MKELLCLAVLALTSAINGQELLEQCKDIRGTSHKVGDSYIGTDGCNKCKCLESGSACTKRLCPRDEDEEARKRSAEANKCVDNLGVLHDENDRYTHVDGCNTCVCTKNGGACTKRFCLESRQFGECVDGQGNTKHQGDDSWMSKDGCNVCICGPFGAVCTEQFCGQHRGWEDKANNAMIDEFTHTKEGTIVNEDGDRPCQDVDGKDRMPGDSWLSPDGCNICLCRGDGGAPACTKMGCRDRLARLVQESDPQQQSGATTATSLSQTLMVTVMYLVIATWVRL